MYFSCDIPDFIVYQFGNAYVCVWGMGEWIATRSYIFSPTMYPHHILPPSPPLCFSVPRATHSTSLSHYPVSITYCLRRSLVTSPSLLLLYNHLTHPYLTPPPLLPLQEGTVVVIWDVLLTVTSSINNRTVTTLRDADCSYWQWRFPTLIKIFIKWWLKTWWPVIDISTTVDRSCESMIVITIIVSCSTDDLNYGLYWRDSD